jgi:transcriptional regulator GlxA family with amidase domain
MKIHPMLDGRRHASASELAVAAMELLSACAMLSGGGTNRAKHLEKITIAERRLSSPIDGPPDLQALAKELSWGYSYFRREFKKQTGLSPWQYHLQARFSLAQRSLMTTNDTLEEIAQSTGFGSAFHLSNAFKKAFGKSPGHWREHQPPEP